LSCCISSSESGSKMSTRESSRILSFMDNE
jgi:hypothetical protein